VAKNSKRPSKRQRKQAKRRSAKREQRRLEKEEARPVADKLLERIRRERWLRHA